MDLHDLFHSPGNRVAAFSQMQQHLYRHVSPQDYFLPLQSGTSPRIDSHSQHASGRFAAFAIHGADKVSQRRPYRKIKTDVLFALCRILAGKPKINFLSAVFPGSRKPMPKFFVCCRPVPVAGKNQMFNWHLQGGVARFRSLIRQSPFRSMEIRLQSIVSRMRGRGAFKEAVQVLEPHGLSPGLEAEARFERTAYFLEARKHLPPWVEFDSVVARCNWEELCSPVSRTDLHSAPHFSSACFALRLRPQNNLK
jgi:hypothetical protein